MRILGFEITRIKRDKSKQKEVATDSTSIEPIVNNKRINMTWELLTDEQKIKVANLTRKGHTTTIMGIGGDIERGILGEVKEYKHGRFIVATDHNFYTMVTIQENDIIREWNELTKLNK